ncbi:Eukaryotic translation initiation factor 3 subunit C [Micractinium conductrix]|uniref:Eukaryotic translation initiation factor 3 subunit C n=1 Tax=Micractinium conductrix TaxID=554055 RepID=A0A2P6VKH4_9CHLO|nr:Eukaryotic translation initiation factor 3 subunit C [Micractinium conductrix]|eukprot:PSC74602.1 Eukaryotic translation initiation factor 3 subunit C [Micractinium conductrix]
MASKFWAAASSEESEEEVTSSSEESSSASDDGSSSGSDSDSSSSSSSSSGSSQKKGASRFLMGSSDSESEDERRVVRSSKDKAHDELRATCGDIKNKMHINDWAAIQTLFDKLNKQMERTQKLTQSLGVPRAYIRMMCELEDFLNKTLAEKPKLSPTNTRALTRMKQTLRKHNAAFVEQMQIFRENPVYETEEEEAPSPSESERGDESERELNTEEEEEAKFKQVRTGVVQRPKDKILSMDPKEITYEMVQKKLGEIAMARGKTTRVDRQEHIEMLTYLAGVTKGPVQKVEILINVITVTFDMNQPTQNAMTVPNWNRCAQTMFDIMALLSDNRQISLTDSPPEEERQEEPEAGAPTLVWGNLGAFLERLDDEWNGSLKTLDPHANEYMDRLKDEAVLLALAQKVSEYLEAQGELAKLAGVALKRIQHFYYKTDVVYSAMRKLALQQAQESAQAQEPAPAAEAEVMDGEEVEGATELIVVKIPADFTLPESCAELVEQLARVVYQHGNDNQKGAAMLCTVYFRCIRDDFYGGRDMLLMSRIQDQTSQLDAKMQVLFNRTIAQLGLSAFRAGLIYECHQCLMDLYGTGRVKELLAQGIQQHRFQEKTPEQEAAERRRQVPFHMHINLELLESTYLISAMLLEVPAMATLQSSDGRKRIISKPLRRLMDNYDRQSFTGPPENVRDHVMAAVRSLSTGDWRRAYQYATALTCWNLLPQKEAVLGMLRSKMQEEGLRTYMLAYGRFYSSLSIAQLCDMFELPERKVHAVVSRLIADDGLPASHDQPTGTVVVHHVEPTRLQTLAGTFSDKASLLVDLNERALAMRTGALHADEDDGDGRRGQDGAQGGRRTRMGGRLGGAGGFGRGGRGGRGGGRYGDRERGSGFMPESGFGGGVFGRGRGRRQNTQRDDSNMTQLGFAARRRA